MRVRLDECYCCVVGDRPLKMLIFLSHTAYLFVCLSPLPFPVSCSFPLSLTHTVPTAHTCTRPSLSPVSISKKKMTRIACWIWGVCQQKKPKTNRREIISGYGPRRFQSTKRAHPDQKKTTLQLPWSAHTHTHTRTHTNLPDPLLLWELSSTFT